MVKGLCSSLDTGALAAIGLEDYGYESGEEETFEPLLNNRVNHT